MTAGAVCLSWNNERSNCSRTHCYVGYTYLDVTSVWDKTNDFLTHKGRQKQQQKYSMWMECKTQEHQTQCCLKLEARYSLGTEAEWGVGGGWVCRTRSHSPCVLTCPLTEPLQPPTLMTASVLDCLQRCILWIRPLVASLFDSSRKQAWAEA